MPVTAQATIVFLYYRNPERARRFYEDVLGLTLTVDQGFCRIYRISPSAFIGLVDEAHGLHRAADDKPVTLSFVVDDVDRWYQELVERAVPIHSPLRDAARHPTRGFVALDPEGYFLEFETFLDHPQNRELRAALATIV